MDGQVLMNAEELITQNYSSSHKAIDLVGEGHSIDDVVAVSDGIVEVAVNTVKTTNTNARGTASYGNYVKIIHNDGTKSLYAHMKYGSVSVKAGDHVTKGQKIGHMGNTGNAHGIHLHFEIRTSNDVRVNPTTYLEKQVAANKPENIPKEEPKPESSKPQNEEPKITTNNVTTPDVKKVTDAQAKSNSVVQNTQKQNEPTVSTSAKAETNSTEFLSNPNYKYGSIVDGLKGIGVDSSFDYREEIAHANGIDNYMGTYDQNVHLLFLLKHGKLKKA